MKNLFKWLKMLARVNNACRISGPKPDISLRPYLFMAMLVLFTYSQQVQAKTIGLKVVNSTGVEGTYINVPVNADTSLTGENVIAFELSFSFNATYLTFDTIVTSGALTAAWTNFSIDRSVSGKIRIVAAHTTALAGTGVLFYLRFYAKTYGTTTVSFNAAECLLNEGSPLLKLTNGNVQATAKPKISVYPNTGIITVGDKLQFGVSGGTSPYTWSVTNAGVASISSTGLLTATAKGFTKVVAADNAGIIDTCDQLVEIRGLKLHVRDTSIFEGYALVLPVYSTNVSGLNIKSGTFTITHNSNLSVSGLVKVGGILNTASDLQYSEVPGSGQCTISFAGSASLTGSGVLCYIELQSTTGFSSSGTVDITNILFNEDILANKQSGYAQVKTLPALSITPAISTLQVGASQKFTATNGTGPYTWTVSDPLLASVGTDGTLTALKSGKVKVMAEDTYGAKGSSNFIDIVAAHLSIHDTTGIKNTTLSIPVWLEKYITGNALYSYQFDIEFDTTKLTFVGLEKTGSLSGNWSVVGNRVDNLYKIAGASTTVINSNGALIYLQMQIKNSMVFNQSTLLKINNIVLNEGLPLTTFRNGYVQNTSPTKSEIITGTTKTQIWPNPSNGNFALVNHEAKPVEAQILNLQGMILKGISDIQPGENKISLDLPNGYYLVKLKLPNGKNELIKIYISN